MVDVTITLWVTILPLSQFVQKTTLNADVNNWGVELSHYDIKCKFIKGIKNTLADTVSVLINLDLTELNSPEGYEYGYAVFEQLPDIYVDSSKHEPVLPVNVNVSNIFATIIKEESSKNIEIKLSLSPQELSDEQKNDTFCSTMLKFINDKKLPSDKYFKSGNGLLHKVMREDNKVFQSLVVLITFSKYVLHQVHGALGHNGTARNY